MMATCPGFINQDTNEDNEIQDTNEWKKDNKNTMCFNNRKENQNCDLHCSLTYIYGNLNIAQWKQLVLNRLIFLYTKTSYCNNLTTWNDKTI